VIRESTGLLSEERRFEMTPRFSNSKERVERDGRDESCFSTVKDRVISYTTTRVFTSKCAVFARE